MKKKIWHFDEKIFFDVGKSRSIDISAVYCAFQFVLYLFVTNTVLLWNVKKVWKRFFTKVSFCSEESKH